MLGDTPALSPKGAQKTHCKGGVESSSSNPQLFMALDPLSPEKEGS